MDSSKQAESKEDIQDNMTTRNETSGQKPVQIVEADKRAAEKNIEVLKAVVTSSNEEQLYQLMDTFTVQLILQKEDKIDDNAVTACNIALNLLPRFLHNVRYEGPQEVLRLFPPSHTAKLNQSTAEDWKPDLTIIFGKHRSKEYVNPMYVSSAGWSVYISRERPCPWSATNHRNFVAAMFAGAMAVGEAFKQMINPLARSEMITTTFEYDLVTHGVVKQPVLEPSIPGAIHLDNFAIVGCGAIGQAFIFALSWATSLTGNIILIDNDKTEPSNEQRYLLAFQENRGSGKAALAKNAIAKTGSPIAVSVVPLKYEQFMEGIDSPTFTEVVAAVDNSETRVNIQASLPKVIWNAWTDTGDKSLRYGIGRHVIGSQYECIACSYFPEGNLPSSTKMASIRTGFSEEEIREREAKNDVVSQEDVERVAKNTGAPLQSLLPNKGKSFKELLHGDCGVFRMQMPQRHETTPAPYTPVLAGVMAAAQVLLSLIKKTPDGAKLVESCAEFDALGTPSAYCVMKKDRKDGCICGDPDYKQAYSAKWQRDCF